MATCDYCGATILFAGVKQGELRYCNAVCQGKGQVMVAAARVQESAAVSLAQEIHRGRCPRCNGPGPVDIHTAYWVWSALVFTRRGSWPLLSCRRCAVKAQLGNLATSAVFGWWGFPWGLVYTPVQITRNLIAMVSPPNLAEPSDRLVQSARIQLASRPMGVAGARSGSGSQTDTGHAPQKDTWDFDEE
jgi:hypothetical protein